MGDNSTLSANVSFLGKSQQYLAGETFAIHP